MTIDDKDFDLGLHGSEISRAEYDRMSAEWLSHGRRLSSASIGHGEGLSVNEVILSFLQWADGYYRKNGVVTGETDNIRYAMKPLRQLYGDTLASRFGPTALKTVRQTVIDSGLCRNEVNRRTRLVVRAFKWAVENEMVPPSIHHGLKAVSGLRSGRGDVRESKPIKPVPEEWVDAIQPLVSRQVWAIVRLQRLTGMRPGEVVSIRTGDVDATGKVWSYTPGSHKTEHHGKVRRIYFGPQAQAILQEWFRTDPTASLFQPREAVAEFRVEQRKSRHSPVQPFQASRAKPSPRKVPGESYTPDSYRQSIVKPCEKAKVSSWHPNQLRHNAATRLRKEFGLDVTRAVLRT